MKYISTRGKAPVLNFEEAMLTGLARDGGLYVPQSIPNFSHDDLADSTFTFTQLPQAGYIERTMISRWEKGASLEMESMLYHEWSKIGKLPYIPHDSK